MTMTKQSIKYWLFDWETSFLNKLTIRIAFLINVEIVCLIEIKIAWLFEIRMMCLIKIEISCLIEIEIAYLIEIEIVCLIEIEITCLIEFKVTFCITLQHAKNIDLFIEKDHFVSSCILSLRASWRSVCHALVVCYSHRMIHKARW